MDHPRPWLRYVAADDLDCSNADLDFDGMEVEGADGRKLGTVGGFIVDSATGLPYYLVVDAGGWFKSKLFLLPIGHVALNRERQRLGADLTRERVERFPGFDLDKFEKLSDDDLCRMDEQIVAGCCPTEVVERPLSYARYERWAHYRPPSWWDAGFFRPDRAERNIRDIAGASARTTAPDTRKRVH